MTDVSVGLGGERAPDGPWRMSGPHDYATEGPILRWEVAHAYRTEVHYFGAEAEAIAVRDALNRVSVGAPPQPTPCPRCKRICDCGGLDER